MKLYTGTPQVCCRSSCSTSNSFYDVSFFKTVFEELAIDSRIEVFLFQNLREGSGTSNHVQNEKEKFEEVVRLPIRKIRQRRMKIAELEQVSSRPDVVETYCQKNGHKYLCWHHF
ncbi:hypothetical protein MTR_2g104475 [Medicago truncatula]|uniref:Uncharacterized protein n=1 Tax=Medicago truncatula TaxID=3880 RepID=A0A072VDT8_MEDTR|nr:hypothetical protein MTR_2g104475 [Medicago truncatula]